MGHYKKIKVGTKLDSLCLRTSCEHFLVVWLKEQTAKIHGHTIQKSPNVDGNTIRPLEDVTMFLKISLFFFLIKKSSST